MELNAVEARIIGSLAEKQLTTPQQYPLSLNALVLACNQSSNRDPVVSYDDGTVEVALSSLKESGLVRFVHPSHGRSVIRYRQVLDERFGLDDRGLSVVSVLLLRGPQTLGELRARTERMADFESLASVEWELERLRNGSEPLVSRLNRQPGQKEERWAQLLTVEQSEEAGALHPVASLPHPRPSVGDEPDASLADDPDASLADELDSSLADEIASLRADVDYLRQEVAALGQSVDDLRRALGE